MNLPQDASPAADVADIGHYLAVLRQRKWSVLLITALVVGSAMLFSFRQTPIYESTSKILLKQITSPTQISQPGASVISLETEREIMLSAEVAIRASDEIDPPEDAATLVENLEVTIPGETQVLEATFSDPDPLRAQQAASAFTDSYLAYKTEQSTEAIRNLRQPLESQIEELTAQLQELDAQIGSGTGAANLQSEHDVLTSQIAVVRAQLSPLTSVIIDPGDVIQAANLPSAAASPNHVLNGAVALFVGLAIGVALAFLRERLDDRLQGREDLEARAGAPVLAIIPKVPGWRKRDRAKLVTLDQPKSPASEAYRTLRTGVLFMAAERGMRTLMVASATSGEGKTTTAANLAVVLAQAGKRVILVSADLRKPRLHRFFGLPHDFGVVNYLAGQNTLSEILIDPSIPNLRVVCSGPVPTAPAELLGSEAMGEMLDELKGICDILIVDTPAVLAVADALTLMPLADGVLYVGHAEATTQGALTHARQQLDQVNADVFGAVLNSFDPSKARGYQYRYYYQYRYAYKDREAVPSRRER
ncbi:MAG: polysaccharide biosynthesis tyrosine autokinase [Actinomycetota bacterium]